MYVVDLARFTFTGDPLAYARITRRSWWSVRFTDGTVINEWDRDSFGNAVDWPQLPREGRKALRLYCPSGETAEFVSPKDGTGRWVQLKLAVASTSTGRHTLAHLIGYLYGLNGETSFACWDYRTGSLQTFVDNAYDCKWEGLGPLAVDHLGIVPA